MDAAMLLAAKTSAWDHARSSNQVVSPLRWFQTLWIVHVLCLFISMQYNLENANLEYGELHYVGCVWIVNVVVLNRGISLAELYIYYTWGNSYGRAQFHWQKAQYCLHGPPQWKLCLKIYDIFCIFSPALLGLFHIEKLLPPWIQAHSD